MGEVFGQSLLQWQTSISVDSVLMGPLALAVACTNCLPAVASMKDMNDRGKILTAAFIAGGGFVFGDYLGFAASAEPQMILPMIGAKLTSGVLGILLASLLSPVLIDRIAGNMCYTSDVK